MLFSSDRREMRRFFLQAWQKHRAGEPLEAFERQLADLIAEHPEYHALLDDSSALEREWTPEHGQSNPFLHLAMHMAIREQMATDRPPGVREVWQRMAAHSGGGHQAEHVMMETLGETLWHAQRENRVPDEQAYLAALRRQAGLADDPQNP